MAKISKEEYKILKELENKDFKWLAKDRYKELRAFKSRPSKAGKWAFWVNARLSIELELVSHLFRFIQWEDEEPWSVQKLIEEYEYSADHVSHVLNERVKALGNAWKESEETEVKSKQELIEKWELAIESAEFYGKGKEEELIGYMKEFVSDLNQLDEPEVLSQEFIDMYKVDYDNWMPAVPIVHLQSLLVPKQEEVDQAYKDGYETGKQHATKKQSEETETVARVLVDYLIASAKLKLALEMEVEELEE